MSFGSGISWSNTHHRQGFWPRINCSQMKLPNFGSPSSRSSSKIRRHFSNKVWHFLTNCHQMETQNLVISFDYSWFLAKNLAYAECPIMKFHYRNSSIPYSICLFGMCSGITVEVHLKNCNFEKLQFFTVDLCSLYFLQVKNCKFNTIFM